MQDAFRHENNLIWHIRTKVGGEGSKLNEDNKGAGML